MGKLILWKLINASSRVSYHFNRSLITSQMLNNMPLW